MAKTIAFVTNQYCCDRIIHAANELARDKQTEELIVLGIMDSEYPLDPQVVDYLFTLSKKNNATMRLIFTEDKLQVMRSIIKDFSTQHILTGMPSSHHSVLYSMWKEFPEKQFYTVDTGGELVEVAGSVRCLV